MLHHCRSALFSLLCLLFMFLWQPGAFVKEPTLCVSLWEVSHRDSPCSKELTGYRNRAGKMWKLGTWIQGNSAGCAHCCECIQGWMSTHRGAEADLGGTGVLVLGNWQMWHVVQEQEPFNTGIIFPGRVGVLPLGQVQRWHVEGGIETKETAA